MYRTLNTKKKIKYKSFLHEVGRLWISKVQNTTKAGSDEQQQPEEQPTQRGPKKDPPCTLCGDFSKHKLDKFVAGGDGKKKYPARQCKVCAACMK
jgi:hypothetical protein